jgi:hypothetical protein
MRKTQLGLFGYTLSESANHQARRSIPLLGSGRNYCYLERKTCTPSVDWLDQFT